MDHVSVLIVAIEVSIGLTGFAGIVVAFQYQNGRQIRRREMLGLTLLVQNGLICSFFAVIPLLLESFNYSLAEVWQISSVLIFINYFIMAYSWKLRLANSEINNKWDLRLYYGMYIPNIPIIVMLTMNIFGIHYEHEFGPFLLALVYPLMIAGIIFAQLILRPLWRSVFKSEREAREQAEAET